MAAQQLKNKLNASNSMMLHASIREEKKPNRSTKESTLWRSYRRKATRTGSFIASTWTVTLPMAVTPTSSGPFQ